KRVPGADSDWVIMIYDDRDRLVLTQDGEQRLESKWSFTKYDVLNRPIMTGEKVLGTAVATLRDLLDGPDWIQNFAAYETLGGSKMGYTSNSIPKNISLDNIHTVTYYDDYSFRTLTEFGTGFNYAKPTLIPSCTTIPQGSYCYEDAAFETVKGQVSGSAVKILGTNQWIKTANYYDDRYRLIQSVTINEYQQTNSRESVLYSFSGWLIESFKEVDRLSKNISIRRSYDYDHTGRLLRGFHELYEDGIGQGEVLLAENKYNELGELIEKNLHVENGTPFQSIDYRYNIRGWLESVNNAQLLPGSNNNDEDQPKDYFGMELIYNELIESLSNE
ncbi:hypothetical protein, partial [Fulvivirga lutimaris]|uniref:hypothetical protein n=1 Tax=Fulvivirga lutimaris TaxID=1819566 RepID=UPI001C8879BE